MESVQNWKFEGGTIVADEIAKIFSNKSQLKMMPKSLDSVILKQNSFDIKIFYALCAYKNPVTFDQVAFLTDYQVEHSILNTLQKLAKLGISNVFPVVNEKGEQLVLEIVQRIDSLKWCAKVWTPDGHGPWYIGTKFYYNSI